MLVLVLVLGSSSSRPLSSSSTPTPTTHHPTPSSPPPKTDNRQPKTASPASPSPKEGPPAPAWESAWREADSKAKALAADQRFGDAAKLYAGLADLFDDLRLKDRAQKAASTIQDQADAAYAALETKAKGLAADKKFDDARAALRPALDRFGLPLKAEAAKKLLAEIEAAEKAGETAKVSKDAKKEDEKGKEIDKAERERLDAEAKKRQEAEAAFAKAMEPVEALAAAWDFSAAAELLPKVSIPSLPKVPIPSLPKVSIPSGGYSEDFARRLSTRREELERLGKLHAKLIDKINKTQPPLKRGSLYIPGTNADLVAADEKSITAKLPDGKTESHPWPGLSPKVIQNLVLRAIDRQSADDWLAAGLLALAQSGMARVDGTVGATHRVASGVGATHGVASGVGATHGVAQGEAVPRPYSAEAVTSAEAAFERARALGASIDRYLDPLAAGAFAQAQGFLEAKKHAEAEAALATLEKKYSATPWLAAHKADLASAREAARAGIAESEAEKLYAEAVKLFEKKELFDLKPIVDRLQKDYPKTKPLTDSARKPTFSEMAEATKTLGKFITVRQDGKGDFKTIQAAIDAAQANSLIEIQDGGSYNEKIEVGREGLVLGGKKGCWPVITSLGPRRNFPVLLLAQASRVTVQRVVLYHGAPGGGGGSECLRMVGERSKLRSVISCHPFDRVGHTIGNSEVSNCVILGFGVAFLDETFVRDSLVGGLGVGAAGRVKLTNVAVCAPLDTAGCEARFCTLLGRVAFQGGIGLIEDSICPTIYSSKPGVRIDRCDVFGNPAYEDLAKPGKACFSADPQFRDPGNFDYRLKPTSPCRKKSPDGGDIGCRYTPEMLEVLEKALELRRKGIIKF